jgi:signal transduction histidine kinase
MLTEFLLLLLVLVVSALMIVDQTRTRDETAHADGPVFGERPAAVPPRAAVGGAFSREPTRGLTPMPGADAGRFQRPEGIGSPLGGDQRPGAVPVPDEGSGRPRAGSDLRSRIGLLIAIPVVAAIVVTLCIVRIAVVLGGTSIHSPVGSMHNGAVLSVIAAIAVLVVALALGAWATVRAARSMLSRWHGLPAGRAAGADNLDSDGDAGAAPGVFDQMRGEISRLTDNEAALRTKLDAMFVNLSHRSRSMAERQIRLIGNLEHGEQDERRLASLERMTRIASHMYRSSMNLLILAGQEPSTGSSQPVTLTHLVQAAVSDIEESERVSFDVQPDIAVRGPAAGDVVHLLAELIQNATSFSAATMPVYVTGRMVSTGGAVVDVTDHGIGMTDKELAYANWQLENPPATNIDAVKWMGLLVVARLAARHGIKVRLNQAEAGGLTALVWLPGEVLMYQAPAANPGHAAAMQRGPRAEPPPPGRLPGAQPPPYLAREDAGMMAPPPESQITTRRLPIFDDVESHWSAVQTVDPPSLGGQAPPALPQRLPTSNPGGQQEH